jgi:sugar lactone lactonase YvrE
MRAFLLLPILPFALIAQEFVSPESAIYDARSKRYFISNFGNGNVIAIDSSGKKQYFKQGLNKPLGLTLVKNCLYLIDNPNTVRGWNINTGSAVMNLQIEGARFLNDIAADSAGFLYITDSNTHTVHKIDIATQEYTLFLRTLVDGPNGILYDKFQDRLIICFFFDKAPIQLTYLEDNCSELIPTHLNNLDGLAINNNGNIYVSSWDSGSFAVGFTRTGAVHKFDNNFRNLPIPVSEGLYGPADIYYNPWKKEIAIPLLLDNGVNFLPTNP